MIEEPGDLQTREVSSEHSAARILRRLVILFAVIGSMAPAASAVPIAFDNFSPGDTADNGGRWFGTIGPNKTRIRHLVRSHAERTSRWSHCG